jgi:hypothetical protein
MDNLAAHRPLLLLVLSLFGSSVLLGACDSQPTGSASKSSYERAAGESAVTADSGSSLTTAAAPMPPSARSRPLHVDVPPAAPPRTSLPPAPTTTTPPPGPTTTPPAAPTTTAPSAPTGTAPERSAGPCASGFVCGHVTAIGDSVMLDAQPCLQADIPGIDVEAQVSRQWYSGVELAQQMRADGTLGSIVVIDLGTNGPVTLAMFQQMMSVLSGASVAVFVTVHLPPSYSWWQSVNETLEQGVPMYSNARLANFNALADQNPDWFGVDGVHMPIGGPGAQAMASLIASTI